MTRTLFLNIGLLVTNDPRVGDGATGEIKNAALLVDLGRIAWVGEASAAEGAGDCDVDHVIDLGGRCLIPGFVDSHSHLVFAGDRTADFEARMAGRAYSAGGILSTVAATRATSDDELRVGLASFIAEARSQGTTTLEIKSGYGLTVHDEERLVRLASEVTEEVTFLGAHVVPLEYRGVPGALADGELGTRADYVDLVTGPMLEACAPYAKWIDVFCDEGAFTPGESRRILESGIGFGLMPRVHASQLAAGEGIRLAVDLAAASVDHCTFLTDLDVADLARSSTVATLLPGVEFSTKQPYPDARRLLDAGVTVALSTDCNPGSSFTSSMPFCLALAVREMGMTAAEALWSATAGGAQALRREDIGRLIVGARADLVELAAPSYVHLAYRPGVPLVRRVWKDGQLVSA